jgi:hypothetical protein
MTVNTILTSQNGTETISLSTIRAMVEHHKDNQPIELPSWVIKVLIKEIEEQHFKVLQLDSLKQFVKQLD